MFSGLAGNGRGYSGEKLCPDRSQLNNSGQTDTALLLTKLSEEMEVSQVQEQVDKKREVTGMMNDEEDMDDDKMGISMMTLQTFKILNFSVLLVFFTFQLNKKLKCNLCMSQDAEAALMGLSKSGRVHE